MSTWVNATYLGVTDLIVKSFDPAGDEFPFCSKDI
jgi:hypothetical protein